MNLDERGQSCGGGHPGGVGRELPDHRDVVLLEQCGQRLNGVVKRRNGVIACQQERLPLHV